MYFMSHNEDDIWYKFKYPDPFVEYKLDLLFKRKIRVKYLDQEDIESLGFKYIGGDDILIGFINNNINIDFFINSKILCIYKHKNKIVFEGIIKNKSELKKLLKQLNIK